jgi:hypothetical protein
VVSFAFAFAVDKAVFCRMHVDARHILRRVLVASVGVLGCGDIDDVQVPLIPDEAPAVMVPMFERAPARVLASIAVVDAGDAGAGACPVSFRASFEVARQPGGPEDVREEAGGSATVACTVRATAAGAARQVEAMVTHTLVRSVKVTGVWTEGAASPASLSMTLTDGTEIGAACRATGTAFRGAGVQFRLEGCRASADGVDVPTCALDVSANFENCDG